MLPFKEGMIRYAYERNLLVQPIIMLGVEHAMSEYTFRRDPLEDCYMEYFFDDTIDPMEFKTNKAFFDHIQDRMFYLFDYNHDLACDQNKRYSMLKHQEEKKSFESAKSTTERSRSMVQYNLDKRKRKRH